MSIGVLLLCHAGVGEAMLATATEMLGVCPLATEVVSVPGDCDPDAVFDQACQRIDRLDSGSGVLVLADLFGSTPANIACRLSRPGAIEVVSGLNLPMLVRVLNYPGLSLPEMVGNALSGGREGIFACTLPD